MTNGRRTPRKILHTSDVHLAALGDKACQSLEALVNAAIRLDVDMVIIAGDFFDYNRVDDDLVSFAVEQLRRLPVPVLVLAGNHDCLTKDSVFNRVNLWQGCTNLRLFRASQGERIDLPDLGISLWGKPIDTYENDVHPMKGIPEPGDDGLWHVAVAHGHYVSNGPHIFPSYHITREEIFNSGWDYIALGHHPVYECIGDDPVLACYSGSPSMSGKVVIVDLAEDTGVQISRYSIWESHEGLL
ncbi:MAG: DNA repair exonuclease [Dehalococcoidales bacterium]|nr:DNA repair exonuclease [Dehalococcoidales bacterium]